MRSLLALALLLLAPLAAARSTHRTHIVDDDMDFQLVRTDEQAWAELTRDGVHYRTTNASILAEIERVMEPHRELSEEHSRLGRRHSELGREHSALGREHARLGREHSRLSRERDSEDAEARQRDLEAEQRKLEDKQRRLEDRQRELEDQQRALESKQRGIEREMYRSIEKIFERAAREGKATRN